MGFGARLLQKPAMLVTSRELEVEASIYCSCYIRFNKFLFLLSNRPIFGHCWRWRGQCRRQLHSYKDPAKEWSQDFDDSPRNSCWLRPEENCESLQKGKKLWCQWNVTQLWIICWWGVNGKTIVSSRHEMSGFPNVSSKIRVISSTIWGIPVSGYSWNNSSLSY